MFKLEIDKNLFFICFIVLLAGSIALNATLGILWNNSYNELVVVKSDYDVMKTKFEMSSGFKELIDAYSREREITDNLIKESKNQTQIIKTVSNEIKTTFEAQDLTVTAYAENSGQTTSLVRHPKSGCTVAVSQDLSGWLGKEVYIDGLGVKCVEDLMSETKVKSLDIYGPDENWCKLFGKRTLSVKLTGKTCHCSK